MGPAGCVFFTYLIPQALQSGVPSSAFLHMGVFLVQHDAQILSSDEGEKNNISAQT